MDDKTSLLNELRIDRSQAVDHRADRRWLWWALGCVVLAAAAVLAWRILLASPVIPVHVVTVQPVRAASAGPGGASLLDASGYVVARRTATVAAKVTGKVMQVLIEEGRYIKKDEIVARLDDTNVRAALEQAQAQLEQARSTLSAAQIALKNAQPTYERSRKQFAAEVISAQDFDTATASFEAIRANEDVARRGVDVAQAAVRVAQRSLDDMVVRAPFSGVITAKNAQQGEMVSPVSAGGGFTRTGIGTIVDMDSLEVEVDVSESFINRVRPGQPVRVQLNAYPDWAIPAEVIAVIPTADRSKATVKVRIGFKEKDPRILPDMGARVSFLAADSPGAQGAGVASRGVLVPEDAVQVDGERGTVWLVAGDTVEHRAVSLGARTPDGQTVLAGLEAGTLLAVGDPKQLHDGARIRIEK